MESMYNNSTYLNNNPTWHEEDAAVKADWILQLLKKNNVAYTSVAEIGCGSGEILVELHKKQNGQVNFYGYDIAGEAIEIANKKSTNDIHFYLQDFTKIQPDIFFDIVLIIDVIEHVENYFSFLDGLKQKSKYAIFHIPLDMCVWALFNEKILIESKDRIGHIHNFTEQFVLEILHSKGFIVLDKMYTPPLFTPTTAKQKLANFLRKTFFIINKNLGVKVLGGYSIMVLTKNENIK